MSQRTEDAIAERWQTKQLPRELTVQDCRDVVNLIACCRYMRQELANLGWVDPAESDGGR